MTILRNSLSPFIEEYDDDRLGCRCEFVSALDGDVRLSVTAAELWEWALGGGEEGGVGKFSEVLEEYVLNALDDIPLPPEISKVITWKVGSPVYQDAGDSFIVTAQPTAFQAKEISQ